MGSLPKIEYVDGDPSDLRPRERTPAEQAEFDAVTAAGRQLRFDLIAACPELAQPFDEVDADGFDDESPHLQMGAIARYLSDRLRANDTRCFGPRCAKASATPS